VTTPTDNAQKNHRRAVRFFWCFLIGATLVSLIGNITRAALPYVPHFVVQIGAAAVPPIVLLAAVHGIALAVRAGASGRAYCCAVSSVAAIGVGAFAVSFLALRDLMQAIGYSSATAWVFPTIVDTTVAVSTLMLVALGDKPARRVRTTIVRPDAEVQGPNRSVDSAVQSAKSQPKQRVIGSARAQQVQRATQPTAAVDGKLAAELIGSGVTTQPVDVVVAVLAARRAGASINAAAKASGINYRTAQRIVEVTKASAPRDLAPTG
jgi:hypothetical protein